jgi:Do/DeqQ family serine protease
MEKTPAKISDQRRLGHPPLAISAPDRTSAEMVLRIIAIGIVLALAGLGLGLALSTPEAPIDAQQALPRSQAAVDSSAPARQARSARPDAPDLERTAQQDRLVSDNIDAAERAIPATREQIRLSFAPVAGQAAPAVVNIYVRQRVRSRSMPRFPDPFFERFFGRGPEAPRQRMEQSLGSGVIVTPEGLIVTNYHVIRGRGSDGESIDIKVAMADGREFAAAIILEDERTDLAVLRLESQGDPDFPYLSFADSDLLEVGDLVLAIGNPFGVGQTVTSGIVSAVARTRVGISDYQFFIQTDAAINPGNSGGALVDMDGKLVGINTAIYSRTGGSLGIGFAIPANMVRLIVESALQGSTVRRPWLGADLQSLTSELAAALGLERPVGALVSRIATASPAQQAGLREGDVILKVDDVDVRDADTFRYRVATKGVGGQTVLGVWRSGARINITVALEAAPEVPARNTTTLEGNHPFTGAKVENLSPAVAEELRIPDTSGVVVRETLSYSPARRIGLRPGDIIVEINDRRIASIEDMQGVLRRGRDYWALTVKRGGQLLRTVLRG